MTRGAIAAVASCLALAALMGCASRRRADAPAEFLVGKVATDYYCAPTADGAVRIARTLADADEDAYRDAIYGAYPLSPGTHVDRVGAQSSKAIEVRVVDGPYAGETCWYPASVKHLLEPER